MTSSLERLQFLFRNKGVHQFSVAHSRTWILQALQYDICNIGEHKKQDSDLVDDGILQVY